MKKLAIIFLCLAAGAAFAKINVGDPAPDFTLPDIRTGEKVSLSQFRGQVVVLHIWKVCSGRCRASIEHLKKLDSEILREIFPDLEEVQYQFGPLLKILSVNAINSPRRVRAVADKYQLDYQVMEGRGSGIARDYQITVLPQIYVIDKEGIIRFIEMYPDYDDLQETVTPLITEIVGR